MTTDSVGGVWSYAVELARALGPLNIDVTLACLGPLPRAHQYAAVNALDNVELVTADYRLEWMPDCEDDLDRAGDWLLELEARIQPDIIHLNGYAHGALPFAAPTLIVGHSCVLSWWRAVKGGDAPPSWDGYRRRVRAGLNGADAVVAPTAWMLSQLLGSYDARFSGLVINNGRRRADYRPGQPAKYVLAAGRSWDQAKNLETLDDAAASLPWPVRVAGPTIDPSGQPVAARNVELIGALASHVLGWRMAQASIFVHPARYEPFGLAPLEAGLSGCALVLGDISSLREIWGDAAVFVAPDDSEALAAALRELIDDPKRRATMASRAELRAKRYGVARMVAAYHDLYLELASDARTLSACAS